MGKKLVLALVYFGIVPFGLSLVTFGFLSLGLDIMLSSLLSLCLGGVLAGLLASKRRKELEEVNVLIFVFFLPLAYTAVLWAIFMLLSGGNYGDNIWLYYSIFHIAMAPIFFFSSFMGEMSLFLWAPLAYELSILLGCYLSLLIWKKRKAFKVKPLLILLTVFFLAMGTGRAVEWQRSKTVLPSYGFKYGGGYSSTDLTPYEISNPDNILPKLDAPATFLIANRKEMPVLDGAEAAFPVYSAFANATYENINHFNDGNRDTVRLENENIISFTNTIYAYERLLSGEVDIYFGAEPSKEQQNMAEFQGKELVMTPIGKEAFVFFVNPKNKVDGLKVSEIQSIYSGEIKNWSEVGGENKRIIAFQRPENSGSQTLLEKIMGDMPIMTPLKEDVPRGMGGIIEQVADYRNYDNAIGFSFRFFATRMRGNPDIKLLNIEGIEPNPENIASEKYPFTANLYAITLKDNPNTKVKPFLEWMTGPQGQEIVEKVGYIKIK